MPIKKKNRDTKKVIDGCKSYCTNRVIPATTKSQAAMEFLMTYGWALLVVLLVIGALSYFGLLNPSRFLPDQCDFGPGISCAAFTAYAVTTSEGVTTQTGGITMYLQNGRGEIMHNVRIYVDECGEHAGEDSTSAVKYGVIPLEWFDVRSGSSSCHLDYEGGCNEYGTPEWWRYSGSPFPYRQAEGTTKGYRVVNCDNLVPNSRFQSDMTIRYTTRINGQELERSQRGRISVMPAECRSSYSDEGDARFYAYTC